MDYEIGMRISEKLEVSEELFRKEGFIHYIYNNGKGLIYREDGSDEDIFILTKNRDIRILE